MRPKGGLRHSRLWLWCGVVSVLLGITSCSGSSTSATPDGSVTYSAAPGAAPRTNIVFVLTDDLSMNLVQYMPHVLALEKAGATFTNYSVTDSLCCPSRSSIFTGKFPHNTGVFTNGGADGGFHVFHDRGDEKSTFATALQGVGYRTAMMGKYLNGYPPDATLGGSRPYVPPGWNEWDVADNGYPEYDYVMNSNHKVVRYGHQPADYLTRVLSQKGSAFITRSAKARNPFFLEVATFAPHAPYTPAPQDENSFPGLQAPRGKSFNTLPTNAPGWLATMPPLNDKQTAFIDDSFRKRVQAVQSVDRMIGSLQATLERTGTAKNTVFVFNSDNGYHMGEYRLNPGKMTAFDTDVHVPLVMSGPGIKPGRTVRQVSENIDLAPTFEQLGDARIPSDVDGRSLVPLLLGGTGASWRTTALVEHHGPDTTPHDPDKPGRDSGNPPSYKALRTATYTYVEYVGGVKEYYDRTTDPDELNNIARTLSTARLQALHKTLVDLSSCHGQQSCWVAAHA